MNPVSLVVCRLFLGFPPKSGSGAVGATQCSIPEHLWKHNTCKYTFIDRYSTETSQNIYLSNMFIMDSGKKSLHCSRVVLILLCRLWISWIIWSRIIFPDTTYTPNCFLLSFLAIPLTPLTNTPTPLTPTPRTKKVNLCVCVRVAMLPSPHQKENTVHHVTPDRGTALDIGSSFKQASAKSRVLTQTQQSCVKDWPPGLEDLGFFLLFWGGQRL